MYSNAAVHAGVNERQFKQAFTQTSSVIVQSCSFIEDGRMPVGRRRRRTNLDLVRTTAAAVERLPTIRFFNAPLPPPAVNTAPRGRSYFSSQPRLKVNRLPFICLSNWTSTVSD